MNKGIGILVIIIFVILGGIYGLGVLAIEDYSGSLTEDFKDRKEIIFQNLLSMDVTARRKQEVDYIEILGESNGLTTWREVLNNGNTRTFRMVERSTPNFLVVERFEDDDGGLTGTWTYSLGEGERKTEVTITEESINKSPWSRGLNTIFGRDSHLKREMKSLRVSLLQQLIKTP